MKCQFCGETCRDTLVDLGTSPPANSFLSRDQLEHGEVFYPLKVMICKSCWLVQVGEIKKHSEIFSEDYIYFSSFSSSWLEHAKQYCEKFEKELGLGEDSFVVEIASNDGYLLKNFVHKGIPCLGVEPTFGTASEAKKNGVESLVKFFGKDTAYEIVASRSKANLVLGNNVLAHVPDIKDFVSGVKVLLATDGTFTFEFPHLLNLMKFKQFDTIYHEHFSYLSVLFLNTLFRSFDLEMYKIEKLETHGGSLRVVGGHKGAHKIQDSVGDTLEEELKFGLDKTSTYHSFYLDCFKIKKQSLEFLLKASNEGKKVVGYGAAAKGNTFLNYLGVKADLIQSVFDLSTYKQGKYLPGARVPVLDPKEIKNLRPDFVILFPWNLEKEITAQLSFIRDWGGQFVIFIPDFRVIK